MSDTDSEERIQRPDAPNQQLVRADGSGPADEGSGGQAMPKSKARSTDTPVSDEEPAKPKAKPKA